MMQTTKKWSLSTSGAYNKAIVVLSVSIPTLAFAEGLDLSPAQTQLGYALAAVGALGALKVAPAALSWVWSMVTRNASRG